jgi:hypothetical protein
MERRGTIIEVEVVSREGDAKTHEQDATGSRYGSG